MIIDCDTCAVRGDACTDCVVTVLLGGPRASGSGGHQPPRYDLDGRERAALAVLAGSGLVPPLRLVSGEPVVGDPAEGHEPRRATG